MRVNIVVCAVVIAIVLAVATWVVSIAMKGGLILILEL